MDGIKNILIPTDFSDSALSAGSYASSLAELLDSNLVFVHLYHMPASAGSKASFMVGRLKEEMEKEAENEMYEFLNKIDYSSEKLKSIVEFGYLGEEINSLIKEEDIDLVIMGTHGASGLKEILGSNTAALLSKAHAPVMAIPHGAEFDGIHKVLLATDYKHIQTNSFFEVFNTIVKKLNSKIEVLNIDKDREKQLENSEAAQDSLDRYLEGIPHEFHEVTSGSLEKGMNEYMDKHSPDLIALMPRQHSIFEGLFAGGFTKKMCHHSKTPLLAIHEDFEAK